MRHPTSECRSAGAAVVVTSHPAIAARLSCLRAVCCFVSRAPQQLLMLAGPVLAGRVLALQPSMCCRGRSGPAVQRMQLAANVGHHASPPVRRPSPVKQPTHGGGAGGAAASRAVSAGPRAAAGAAAVPESAVAGEEVYSDGDEETSPGVRDTAEGAEGGAGPGPGSPKQQARKGLVGSTWINKQDAALLVRKSVSVHSRNTNAVWAPWSTGRG